MATYTTNYNLKKPGYGDTADIADINGNLETIDNQMKANATYAPNIGDMVKIVNGKQSTTAVSVGQIVKLINSTISGKENGMYKAAKAISANTNIDGTYLTAISGGAINNTLTMDQVINAIYPVGSVYISFNSSMPSYLTSGRTWTAVSGNYVLKTVTSGTGGSLSNAGNTGSHTLTTNEIPSHNHGVGYELARAASPSGSTVVIASRVLSTYTSTVDTKTTGGGQGHTHTAGMPANVAVYMWKRTA